MAKKLEVQLEEAQAELKEVEAEEARQEAELDIVGLDAAYEASSDARVNAAQRVHKLEHRELRRLLGFGESATDAAVNRRLRALACAWAGLSPEDVKIGADCHGDKSLGKMSARHVKSILTPKLDHPELREAREAEERADAATTKASERVYEARRKLSPIRRKRSRLVSRVREIQEKINRRVVKPTNAKGKAKGKAPPATDKPHHVAARKKLRRLTGYGRNTLFARDEAKSARRTLEEFLTKELDL